MKCVVLDSAGVAKALADQQAFMKQIAEDFQREELTEDEIDAYLGHLLEP